MARLMVVIIVFLSGLKLCRFGDCDSPLRPLRVRGDRGGWGCIGGGSRCRGDVGGFGGGDLGRRLHTRKGAGRWRVRETFCLGELLRDFLVAEEGEGG
eukprot:700102-Amorphochlora_amoeboformis.AAC.1